MKNTRWYRVSFDTKENNREYHHFTDVEAVNMKAAREIAEERWYNRRKNHMFHISVDRIKEQDRWTLSTFALYI